MERKGNKEERKSSEGIPPEDVISDLPTSSSASHSHDPTKMSTKERMRRLQAICKEGKTPLSSKMSANQREKHVEHIDTPDGKRFACATKGGINDCLARWMREGTRIMVKIRAFAPHGSQEPNRILKGAIVAFDKHWNMVLRDVDEVYVPSIRLGKTQSMPGAMPSSIRYIRNKRKPGRPVLLRHLKCSFITGSSIVLINNKA